MDQDSSQSTLAIRAAAFSVHVFTALGAGVALIAMLEAVREHWAAMFAWLGVALVVDAVDGPEVDPTVPTVVPTEFVPENLTWNLQVDRTFTPWMAGRASFVSSHSENLYVVTSAGSAIAGKPACGPHHVHHTGREA